MIEVLLYDCRFVVKTLLDLTFQDITDEQVKWPEAGRLTKQPFYNFLPPSSAVNGPLAGSGSNNGEQAEAVDLNLKL